MVGKIVCLLFLVSLTHGFQQREVKSTVGPSSSALNTQTLGRLDSESSLNKEKMLFPEQITSANDDNGLIEVKEGEIPEGSLVYVLEEPLDKPVDGEILKTADNIVFRPLFRYREKQEAQRRNFNRVRRRYFVPRRSYRQTYPYRYPYYYSQRYY